ncbi:MAG: helix-turn-helix domain-containing protein [Clostridiales Family XIII bacterium]|nr:helix-turn-helix domain-containing protein [Clostridiales Family XIII bacterium]
MTKRLTFPMLYNGETRPRGDLLYIAKASSLSAASDLSDSPNFICVGVPPESLNLHLCNIVWFETDVDLHDLFLQVSELFYSYHVWYSSLQDAIAKDAPLRVLGELSEPVFRNPLQMYDLHFMSMFSVFDESRYTLPNNYFSLADSEYMPISSINKVMPNAFFQQNLSNREPYILKGLDVYDSLCLNLFIGEKYIATLTMNEIGHKATNRDFALIVELGKAVESGIQRRSDLNFSVTRNLDRLIRKLVNGEQADETSIVSALGKLEGWKIGDTFSCLVSVVSEMEADDKLLSILAEQICATHRSIIYAIIDNKIVFILNLTIAKHSAAGFITLIRENLSGLKIKIGVGVEFKGFQKLVHCHKQASIALVLGAEKDPFSEVHYFRNYMLDWILSKCSVDDPELFCPSGLKRLIRYDEEKHTDLTLVLRTYLKNNMNAVKTAHELYMHRNSLLYKLQKIKRILGDDSGDSETRLLLLLAFRLLDRDRTRILDD